MKYRIHDNPVLGNRVEFKELCEETKGTRTVAEIVLRPGGRVPLHYHRAFSEFYEVLEGELEIRIGKETRYLQKGENVLVQENTNHCYFNRSKLPVRFKVVIQPGNIGFQLLIAILNGLAKDGKVNRRGLPKSFLLFGYVSVVSGSNIPGLMSFLQPMLNWMHRIAVRRGVEKKLLSDYYC